MDNKKKNLVTAEKYRKLQKKRSKVVMFFITTFFAIIFLISFGRVVYIEVFHQINGKNLVDTAEKMYEEKRNIQSKRGTITTSDGQAVAVNLNTYDMYAILDKNRIDYGEPNFVSDPDGTAKAIDPIVCKGDTKCEDVILSQLKSDSLEVQFGIYGKDLSLEQKEDIEALKLPGIEFNENSVRYYPYGDFASYIIGYYLQDENGNDTGKMGVESALNGYLSGEDGTTTALTDYHNIPLTDTQASYIAKSDGSDVELTIDSQIQNYIQEAMDKYYKKIKSDLAFTVVMDANDGSILGAYALPSFNPNTRDISVWYNPFTFCYEPGSTIKTMLVSTAIQEGVWTPDKTYQSGRRHKDEWGDDSKGNPYYISDWLQNDLGYNWGKLTWKIGYYYSSNVAMTYILDAVTNDVYKDYMTNVFEFGQPVNEVVLNNTKETCTYNPQYDLDYANTAFGQGMTANALQMLRAYSIVANDGVMLTPHIVKQIQDPKTKEIIYSDDSLKQVEKLPKTTTDQMVELLNGVIDYRQGTDTTYWGGGYEYGEGTDIKIGGKTGTAQIAVDGSYSGTTDYQNLLYSFMGLVPYKDPQFLIYTVVMSPESYPVPNMAKSVDQIINNTYSYMSSSNDKIDFSKMDNNRYQLEDYQGQDISTVATKLKKDGMKVITIGDGKINNQYPDKKQIISKNQTIVLHADGTYDSKTMVGLSFMDSYAICQAMDWQCSYSGNGNVAKVESTEQNYYNITLQPPNGVTVTG